MWRGWRGCRQITSPEIDQPFCLSLLCYPSSPLCQLYPSLYQTATECFSYQIRWITLMLDEIVWNYGFVSKVSCLMSSRIKCSIEGLWGNTEAVKRNSTADLAQAVLLRPQRLHPCISLFSYFHTSARWNVERIQLGHCLKLPFLTCSTQWEITKLWLFLFFLTSGNI